MKRILLTLMIVIVLVPGTSTVLMAGGGGGMDPITEYRRQVYRWELIKFNQEVQANGYRLTKEGYNNSIEELEPELQAAEDEYNSIETRRIIAIGEKNAAYSDMMYANSMLDSLSNRSPSQVPPGAWDYWTGRRNEARDRYNRYSAEVPMIEAELATAKTKLDDLQGRMDNLISKRDYAKSKEDYHSGKVTEAQTEIDRLNGLIDELLPDPDDN